MAKFGRGFLDLYDPTDFVTMGQTLKVLNAVRFHEIGIPVTYAECVPLLSAYELFLTALFLGSPTHLPQIWSHVLHRVICTSLHCASPRIYPYLRARCSSTGHARRSRARALAQRTAARPTRTFVRSSSPSLPARRQVESASRRSRAVRGRSAVVGLQHAYLTMSRVRRIRCRCCLVCRKTDLRLRRRSIAGTQTLVRFRLPYVAPLTY